MKQTIYYTIIIGKRSCLVTYAQPPEYSVKLFSSSFATPDLAHEEVKRTFQCERTYLTEGAFDSRVRRLSEQYQCDEALLQAWNQGQPSTTPKKGRSPMALTNEQYFSLLPTNGLELAEEYLEQDLETLQENDLPVSDTVTGLLMVHARLEGQEDTSCDV